MLAQWTDNDDSDDDCTLPPLHFSAPAVPAAPPSVSVRANDVDISAVQEGDIAFTETPWTFARRNASQTTNAPKHTGIRPPAPIPKKKIPQSSLKQATLPARLQAVVTRPSVAKSTSKPPPPKVLQPPSSPPIVSSSSVTDVTLSPTRHPPQSKSTPFQLTSVPTVVPRSRLQPTQKPVPVNATQPRDLEKHSPPAPIVTSRFFNPSVSHKKFSKPFSVPFKRESSSPVQPSRRSVPFNRESSLSETANHPSLEVHYDPSAIEPDNLYQPFKRETSHSQPFLPQAGPSRSAALPDQCHSSTDEQLYRPEWHQSSPPAFHSSHNYLYAQEAHRPTHKTLSSFVAPNLERLSSKPPRKRHDSPYAAPSIPQEDLEWFRPVAFTDDYAIDDEEEDQKPLSTPITLETKRRIANLKIPRTSARSTPTRRVKDEEPPEWSTLPSKTFKSASFSLPQLAVPVPKKRISVFEPPEPLEGFKARNAQNEVSINLNGKRARSPQRVATKKRVVEVEKADGETGRKLAALAYRKPGAEVQRRQLYATAKPNQA